MGVLCYGVFYCELLECGDLSPRPPRGVGAKLMVPEEYRNIY